MNSHFENVLAIFKKSLDPRLNDINVEDLTKSQQYLLLRRSLHVLQNLTDDYLNNHSSLSVLSKGIIARCSIESAFRICGACLDSGQAIEILFHESKSELFNIKKLRDTWVSYQDSN